MSQVRRGGSEGTAYWRKLISAWSRSGQTQAAFCRKQGVKYWSFCWWKRKLALEGGGAGHRRPRSKQGPRGNGRTLSTQTGAFGVAIREFRLRTGFADYLLYADGRAIGVIEAKPEGRWRCFEYQELAKRDKVNLDIFWLKDKSLEDSEDLPEPDVLAQEIADDLQTALDQFSAIAGELGEPGQA